MLVVPGGPARCVDGARARAQQGRLRLAQRGGALPARGSAGRGQEPVQRVLAAPAGRQPRWGEVAVGGKGVGERETLKF